MLNLDFEKYSGSAAFLKDKHVYLVKTFKVFCDIKSLKRSVNITPPNFYFLTTPVLIAASLTFSATQLCALLSYAYGRM